MQQPPITVDAWIDLARLDCYLGLHALRTALRDLPFSSDVTVKPRPFLQSRNGHETVQQQLTSSGGDLEQVSRQEGIRLNLDAEIPASTKLAQRLLLQALEQDEQTGEIYGADTLALRMAESIMRTLFEIGADIEHPDVLIGVAQDLQMEGAIAAHALGDELLAIQVQQAYEMGIYLGVSVPPTFVLNDAFVVEGRQTKAAFQNVLTAVREQSPGEGVEA